MRRDLHDLPRAIWILSAGALVNRLGAFVWYFLALFLVQQGYGAAEAGLALAAFGAGTIPASLVGGWLADTLGRRETIAVSMFSGAATFVALSQARAVALIVALVALAGFTSELYRPASSALIADLTPPGHRVTAYALYRLAFNAGIAAGGVLAGVAASGSLTAVFFLDSASCVVFGLLALFALPATSGVTRSQPAEALDAPSSARLPTRTFARFLGASTLIIVVQLQQSSALPLHIDAVGLAPAVLGLLLAVNGAFVLVVSLPASALARRWPHGPLMAGSALLVGTGMAATGAADTTGALLATVVVWTMGEVMFFPLASAYVADTAPTGMQGRYQGWFGAAWSIGITLGPPAGVALHHADPLLVWLSCAVAGAMAAALLPWSSSGAQPQTAQCCATCC